MVLVKFSCSCFLIMILGPLYDNICLLEVVSGVSLHLRVTAALVMATEVIELLIGGQHPLLRLHLAVVSTV